MEHPSLLLTNAPMKRLQRELKEISKYERARKLMETIKIIISDISLFLCFSHKLKGPVTIPHNCHFFYTGKIFR